MRQQRIIAAVLSGVVVTSGAGWTAGSRMRSPAQVAADTAPPEASLITAPVEKRSLSSTVTTRGTVRYGQPQSVTLAASSLGGGTGGAGSSLVTKPPEKGKDLAENAVALEVSGRPVHVLQGAVPMYRDLRPGDTGADVAQLEEALDRLGFKPGKVDGTYDAATEGAVDAWYSASGYTAQGPTDEERDALRGARAGVSAAEDQALQAAAALDKAEKGVTARDIAMAEADVRASQRDRARAGEDLDGARADEVAASGAEATARADEDATRRRAAEQVAAAEADLADSERRLAAAQAGEPGVDPNAAATTVDGARRALDEARRSADADKAAAAAATRQAAEMAVKAARAVPEALRAVAAADDKLALARLSLESLRTPPDTATARAMVTKSARDLAEARRQLAELDGEVGVVVPADEVLFFPSLPLRVDEPKVARGDPGSNEVMVVSTSRLAVDASVSIPDATLVKVGDKATVRSTDLGLETTGTVTKLATKPGTDGVDAQKVYMEVVPDDPPAELTGAAVRITIAVKSTGGDVLAVPVAALSVGSDGTSRVQVAGSDGDVRTVAVEPGLSAEGFVEVKAAGGRLAEGDRVIVGSDGR